MNILSILENLERRRKKIRFFSIIPTVSLFGIFFSQFILLDSFPMFFYFLIILGTVAISSIYLSNETKEFKKIYKETFVVETIKEILGDVTYEPLSGFTEDEVKRTGIINMGNRFYSEDYLSGTYDGVHFRQSDVVVKRVVHSGKSTHTYIHFNGRLFEFDFPQESNTSTLLFSKNYQYPGKGNGMQYQKIQLENDAFNKKFTIKSVNELDAFYILTPHMMECIDELLKNAKSLSMHFTNNKLYIGINSGGKGAFDANMKKPLVYADEVFKVKEDTKVIINIVKTLKLEKKAMQQQLREYESIEESTDSQNKPILMTEEEAFFNQTPSTESKFDFKLRL